MCVGVSVCACVCGDKSGDWEQRSHNWGVEPGNEAGEWSLGMRLGSGAWERGWGVEPGNEAGEWSMGTRLGSGAWE